MTYAPSTAPLVLTTPYVLADVAVDGALVGLARSVAFVVEFAPGAYAVVLSRPVPAGYQAHAQVTARDAGRFATVQVPGADSLVVRTYDASGADASSAFVVRVWLVTL